MGDYVGGIKLFLSKLDLKKNPLWAMVVGRSHSIVGGML
jgi:hypothetical protein